MGRLYRMEAMQQQAMAKAAARFSVAEGQRIQDALRGLDSGAYVLGIVCDEEIGEAAFVSIPGC